MYYPLWSIALCPRSWKYRLVLHPFPGKTIQLSVSLAPGNCYWVGSILNHTGQHPEAPKRLRVKHQTLGTTVDANCKENFDLLRGRWDKKTFDCLPLKGWLWHSIQWALQDPPLITTGIRGDKPSDTWESLLNSQLWWTRENWTCHHKK